MSEKCTWEQQDLDDVAWTSSCNMDFYWEGDCKPDFRFCPYCGKTIDVKEYKDDDQEA